MPFEKPLRNLDCQRWDGNRRLIAGVVPIRRKVHSESTFENTMTLQNIEILVISSSKHSNQWIFPKGGWEINETLEECAQREAIEEAGIVGNILTAFEPIEYSSKKGNSSRLYGFLLDVTQDNIENWKEKSNRQSKWISFEMAKHLAQDRVELLHLLRQTSLYFTHLNCRETKLS